MKISIYSGVLPKNWHEQIQKIAANDRQEEIICEKKELKELTEEEFEQEVQRQMIMLAERKRKNKARAKAQYALKTGKLIEKPCEVCGEKAEMHHEDYDKPLEVIWVCNKHHDIIHSERKGTKYLYIEDGLLKNSARISPK
jgi:hypothetical protein